MYKTELVVASYKENLNWVKLIKSINKISVYNRDPNCNFQGAINVPLCGGREAYIFLTHIILNYEQLADYTIFVQGNPFEQLSPPGILNEINFDSFLFNHEYKTVQEPLYWRTGCPFTGKQLVHEFTGKCKTAYADIFQGEVPEEIYFCPGGQYIVPRANILSKSLKFYEALRERITPIRTHHQDGFWNAWTLEGLWDCIYDINIKEKPITEWVRKD